MPHSHDRPQRVADLLQRTLAQLLLREVNDPRLKQVTITAVSVSPDLKNAKVFFTMRDEMYIPETISALNKASGYLRHLLTEEVELRIMPKMVFVYDESIRRADRISKLIDEALKPKKI